MPLSKIPTHLSAMPATASRLRPRCAGCISCSSVVSVFSLRHESASACDISIVTRGAPLEENISLAFGEPVAEVEDGMVLVSLQEG